MRKTTFLIVGKHAVIEALKNPSRKIERVFLTEDAQKKLNRENQSLNLLKNINVFYKSRKELDNLCGRDETAHQGLVAEVEQLEEITLKEFVLDNKGRRYWSADWAKPEVQAELAKAKQQSKEILGELILINLIKYSKEIITNQSIHKQVHISLNSKDFKVKYNSVPIPPSPKIPINVTPLIAHSSL